MAFPLFAAFGLFWGVWGASIPRLQDQAGLSNGQLGLALLLVGAGALPAMLGTGRVLDRWGLRPAAWLAAALGATGAVVALTANDLVSLSVGLAFIGAVSGAADVGINAVAGRAEQNAGRPVITRAHGVFSAAVVAASLLTGANAAAGGPVALPFLLVAGLTGAAAAIALSKIPAGRAIAPKAGTATTPKAGRAAAPKAGTASAAPPGTATTPSAGTAAARGAGPRPYRKKGLILIGLLGGLAFAAENAHQSWSAVFAQDALGEGPGLTAIAPAVFAGTVAVTRFALGGLGPAHTHPVLLGGSLAAATGALIIAAAPTLAIAAAGLMLAAAGSAVLFPTLVGVVSRAVPEEQRGRATSLITTVAYLGFLLGPPYVGWWADFVSLRGAMVAVAALGALLSVLAVPLLRLSRR